MLRAESSAVKRKGIVDIRAKRDDERREGPTLIVEEVSP
jgi:hypothetical protein